MVGAQKSCENRLAVPAKHHVTTNHKTPVCVAITLAQAARTDTCSRPAEFRLEVAHDVELFAATVLSHDDSITV
jgi:hypothetical protein